MSDYTSTPSRPASPVGDLPEIPSTRPFRFTWDPSSSKRKGPASVMSEATEGRGDYFGVSPRADLFGTAPNALAPGVLPSEWSSSKHGFHAISTVLNNPHKKQAPPKAHSALPSVPPADLPRVRRKDFDSYLRAVAPEWERFERNTQLGREGAPHLDTSSTPRNSISVPEAPRVLPGRSIPSLDTVPPIFFETRFNLGDPRTFNLVTEQREDDDKGGSGSDPSSLSHSLPLLEKLSHYADTIEQHLVQEISLRSTSFFAALTNLHDLRTESEQCLDRISKLRGLLNDVDEKGAKRGLEVIRRDAKSRNLGKVKSGVKEVERVVEMTGVAKGLVGAGRWGEALTVIEEMEALWEAGPIAPASARSQKSGRSNGTPSTLPPMPESPEDAPHPPSSPPLPIPLSSLKAFSNLPSHLRTLTTEIASSLTTELVNVLRIDLVERINLQKTAHNQQADIDQTLRDRLRPLLQGLARTKGMREVTVSWREVVLSEVKATIKQHIPSLEVDEDTKGASKSGSERGTAAGHLRSMAHAEFVDLLSVVYRTLLGCIEGLQKQNVIIVEILQSIQSSKPSTEIPALQEELSDVLASAAELSNNRVAKAVGYRSEQHAALDLVSFLSFFNDSWSFVVKCEVICRRMIVSLRGVVSSQAKMFLQTFHQTRISQSAKLVEEEQWNPADVTPSLQRITDTLVDSAVHDSPELLLTSGPTSPPPTVSNSSLLVNGTQSPTSPTTGSHSKMNGTSSATAKYLRIEDRNYFTVTATADVLGLLLDYLRVIINLSLLTTETMGRIIEFLKAFNSRTCQVVLGAGAMRSAGLKNITAKHLALASQSLSIMIALIPYVRETFRRHLSPTQAVMLVEFDKLKRDYQEHQNEIHAKLIAIMGDRLSAHIKTLQAINWDAPKQGPGVNDYMELLVKETVTLHKVLSRYLSTPIVEYVMTQVFAAINHRLSEEYATIELPNQEAKDRLLADARFLHQKFSALKNVGSPSTMLETVISEKALARQPAPVSPKRSTPSANERIKGILSRKDTYASVDKALPIPKHSLPSTPLSNTPPIGDMNGSRDSFLGTPSRPSTPRPEPKPGFKQVTGSTVLESARPESPLPALPDAGTDSEPRPESASRMTRVKPAERPPRTSSLPGQAILPDGSGGPDQDPTLNSSSPGHEG